MTTTRLSRAAIDWARGWDRHGTARDGRSAPGRTVQPPGGFGTVPAESGTPHAGEVNFAESAGGSPNWILPIATVATQSVANVIDFDYLMWRPLYWPDDGGLGGDQGEQFMGGAGGRPVRSPT
jgi:hypothetical protein